MIAPQAMGRNANGIVITQPLSGPVTYTRNKIQDRAWNDKMYFLPIILDEMNEIKTDSKSIVLITVLKKSHLETDGFFYFYL